MIKPLGGRIFVKRVESVDVSVGGIIIPETARQKAMEGTIIAVGPGNVDKKGKREVMHVKVGDQVVFGKWSGTDITLNNEEFVIIEQDNIIGILNNA